MSEAVQIEVELELDGLDLRRELGSGRWVLDGWGRRVHVREWRWAERRRLLEACAGERRFAGGRFMRALLELVCDPVPPEQLHPLYTHVVLRLFGVDGRRPLPRLDACERAFAREFGWPPSSLDEHSAVDLDRLTGELVDEGGPTLLPARASAPSAAPPPGWKRIVIEDDPS